MSDMRERLARIVMPAAFEVSSSERVSRSLQTVAFRRVDAILAELQEPTPKMVEAGSDMEVFAIAEGSVYLNKGDVMRIYCSMIDAAKTNGG